MVLERRGCEKAVGAKEVAAGRWMMGSGGEWSHKIAMDVLLLELWQLWTTHVDINKGTWSAASIERQLMGAIAVAIQKGNARGMLMGYTRATQPVGAGIATAKVSVGSEE